MIIAIDGPSGAGKSSVTHDVTKRLGASCLDTGAMYRAVAWLCLQKQVSLEDQKAMGDVARICTIEFEHENNQPAPTKVLIDDIDVTQSIRTSQIDKAVTPVSAAPSVREALLHQQQRIANAGNIDYVVEGRDIGTVVFPHAELKIFLTATNEARATRRVKQNSKRGVGSTDFDEVLADLARRDQADSSRAVAPLKPAPDAIHIDSSNMTQEEVVDKICSLANEVSAKRHSV